MAVGQPEFRVTIEERIAGGVRVPVYVLHDTAERARAEVWPSNGFNCFRWQTRIGERWGDWLYVAPDWEQNPVPTRSGFPILFPFPNRIRGGVFNISGQTYQLPLNDSSGKNAIHGFAPRQPWQVVATSTDATSARITGQLLVAPEQMLPGWSWPGRGKITVEVGLLVNRLSLVIRVDNTDATEFPFGLGFHPYFHHPECAATSIDEVRLWAPTATQWELQDNLPTGRKIPAPVDLSFANPTPLAGRVIDHVYGDLDSPPGPQDPENRLVFRGGIGLSGSTSSLTMWTTPNFRELVLFTPPHRQAVCIEPYTCTTDAIHLQSQGIDAGWEVLSAGASWHGVVELRIAPESSSPE